MDEDYALALQLQSDFFQEGELSKEDNSGSNNGNLNAGEPLNLVDPYWELTDPNPDIRALFLQFNERFFWGRLAGIEIRWSPRMTLCAGLCCYEGRGGLCSVRLSVPLLKLRPRKDLVETLLHEMIHAYLFVTDNNKDHDGHGPEFHKHMYRINKEAGTSISVYHNFHDEVEACRQHWWRCDGPCRSRKPYFGYVKRSMNRAPSKNDTWWAEHQRSCGGTYTKVKEPEGYGKKKGKTESEDEKKKDSSVEKKKDKGKSAVKSMDIRIFGGDGKTLGGNKKDLISATKTAADVNSIPKPFTSQTVPVAKPVHTQPSREDNLTDKGFDSKKSGNKSSYQGNALPGGKTPKRDPNLRNKPVSQGGTAKFKEKKSLFHVTDFFESDEDDELLASIPLDNLLGNSNGASRDSENFSDTQGEINQSDEIVTNLSDANDYLGTSVTDTGAIQSGDKHNEETSSQIAQEKINPRDSLTHNNEADDVITMLRKVWGQKQFENKFNGSKSTKDKTKLPLNFFDSGEKFTDGKLRAGVSEYKTNTTHSGADRNSVISSNKRLSDTNSEISPPVKRRRSGDWKTFDTDDFKHDDIVQPKPTDTRPNGTEEKSTCPICNTLVLLSNINDHLDLCLTLQAIK